jgi:hypothetical protein
VVCLAPRAPGDSVRPRRLSGVIERPLNFPVRGHLGKFSAARSKERPRFTNVTALALADSVVLQASSFGASDVRVRPPTPSMEVGARAQAALFVSVAPCPLRARREPASVVAPGGALYSETMSRSLAAALPHAHSALRWVTSNKRLERASGGE